MPGHFDPAKHHRRSIRLKGYDYTLPGAYFITVLTKHREALFGQVRHGSMHPNPLGDIVLHAWLDLPNHYPHLVLDTFCLMPDHLHAIICLVEITDGSGKSGSAYLQDIDSYNKQARPHPQSIGSKFEQIRPGPTRHGLPEIVRALKSFSARRINLARGTPGVPVWQRDYYEHIIRNPEEHRRISAYILSNPSR